MAFKAFKKIAQKDFPTSKMQDNSEQFNNQLQRVPFLNGNRIQSQTITTSTVRVEHKLGREPLGYIITSQSADARIWKVSQDELFLTLDASASVVIDLWVF